MALLDNFPLAKRALQKVEIAKAWRKIESEQYGTKFVNLETQEQLTLKRSCEFITPNGLVDCSTTNSVRLRLEQFTVLLATMQVVTEPQLQGRLTVVCQTCRRHVIWSRHLPDSLIQQLSLKNIQNLVGSTTIWSRLELRSIAPKGVFGAWSESPINGTYTEAQNTYGEDTTAGAEQDASPTDETLSTAKNSTATVE